MVQSALDPTSLPSAADPGTTSEAKRRGVIRTFVDHNKSGTIGFIMFFAILLLAFVGPFLMPGDNRGDYRNVYAPPSMDHFLGTDYQGKDIWFQIVHGGRSILLVAAGAAILSTGISIIFGALAALLGGRFDAFVLMFTDVVLTVPGIILLGVLAAFVRLNSPFLLVLILGLTGWPTLLLAVRAQVLSLKEREYIEAARMLDLGLPRILFREVLPNMMSYIVINFVLGMTGAIYGQVILYFLGLVSLAGNNWGLMIQQAYVQGAHFFKDSFLYIFAPIFVITVLQLSLVLISRALEDVFNPRLRES
jgi:peptide/nickel transport system permease protein